MLRLLLFCLVTGLVGATPASADLIEIRFQGTVTYFSPLDFPDASYGDPVFATLRYDTNQPDLSPDPDRWEFTDYRFEVSGVQTRSNTSFLGCCEPLVFGPGFLSLDVPAADSIAGFTLFGNFAGPWLKPGQMTGATGEILITEYEDDLKAAIVTAMTITRVPEPTAILLMATAAAGVALRRRWRRAR